MQRINFTVHCVYVTNKVPLLLLYFLQLVTLRLVSDWVRVRVRDESSSSHYKEKLLLCPSTPTPSVKAYKRDTRCFLKSDVTLVSKNGIYTVLNLKIRRCRNTKCRWEWFDAGVGAGAGTHGPTEKTFHICKYRLTMLWGLHRPQFQWFTW